VVQGIGWFAVLDALLGDALPYPLVLVLVYVVSIPIGFLLYRIFVFQITGQWLTDFARFILIQAGAFAINLSALPFFHEILGLPLLASQALSIAVILLFSYTGHLYVSFRRRHDHHRQADPWAGDPAGVPPRRSRPFSLPEGANRAIIVVVMALTHRHSRW
jgi:putative flippase GtrA